jgi:hypothetical protein
MARNLNEKIDAAKAEIKQKEALIKQLLQQQRATDRKVRNHRLCKRGGFVEKHLPDLIKLTDEQFETFVKKTLLTGHTAKILKELVPPTPVTAADQQADVITAQGGNKATTTPTEATAHPEPAFAESAEMAQNVGANGNGGTESLQTVAS